MSPKAFFLLVIYSVLKVGSVRTVLFNELQRLELVAPGAVRGPEKASLAGQTPRSGEIGGNGEKTPRSGTGRGKIDVPREIPQDLLPLPGDELIQELEVQTDDDGYTRVFKGLWRACCRPAELQARLSDARAAFQASKI